MFLEVTALKRLSYEGQRQPGDRFIMRRQHAKIFKAKGQVEIHPETLRENKTLAPIAQKETKVIEPINLVQKTITEPVEATNENVDNPVEVNVIDNQPVAESEVVVKTTKKRKSKYEI